MSDLQQHNLNSKTTQTKMKLIHEIKFKINLEILEAVKKIELGTSETEKSRAIFLLGLEQYNKSISEGFTPCLVQYRTTRINKLHFILNPNPQPNPQPNK